MADNHRLLLDEILTDIFSRLRAKSVGRCKCLSKKWHTNLSTSHFINLHLSRETQQEHLILVTPANSLHTIKSPIKDHTVSTKLNLQNTWAEVVGSCNGLVLLLDRKGELFLVNPTTLEQLKVPNNTPPDSQAKSPTCMLRGFGYDSSTDDCKILLLSYYETLNEHAVKCFYTTVDVYSVKSGICRRIDNFPNDFYIRAVSNGAFTNGAIHWFCKSKDSNSPPVIVAFNLADEVFHTIPSPAKIYDGRNTICRVLAVGGSLCAIDPLSNGNIDVWSMKEYGMADSWNKFTVNATGKWDMITPLCFTKDGDVVLATYEEILVVYNVQQGMIKSMVVNGASASFVDGVVFVESLVSPMMNHFMMLHLIAFYLCFCKFSSIIVRFDVFCACFGF